MWKLTKDYTQASGGLSASNLYAVSVFSCFLDLDIIQLNLPFSNQDSFLPLFYYFIEQNLSSTSQSNVRFRHNAHKNYTQHYPERL